MADIVEKRKGFFVFFGSVLYFLFVFLFCEGGGGILVENHQRLGGALSGKRGERGGKGVRRKLKGKSGEGGQKDSKEKKRTRASQKGRSQASYFIQVKSNKASLWLKKVPHRCNNIGQKEKLCANHRLSCSEKGKEQRLTCRMWIRVS
jgi:hypothetical protein